MLLNLAPGNVEAVGYLALGKPLSIQSVDLLTERTLVEEVELFTGRVALNSAADVLVIVWWRFRVDIRLRDNRSLVASGWSWSRTGSWLLSDSELLGSGVAGAGTSMVLKV